MIGKPSFIKQIRVFTPRVQINTYVHTAKIRLITLPFYKKKHLLRKKYMYLHELSSPRMLEQFV